MGVYWLQTDKYKRVYQQVFIYIYNVQRETALKPSFTPWAQSRIAFMTSDSEAPCFRSDSRDFSAACCKDSGTDRTGKAFSWRSSRGCSWHPVTSIESLARCFGEQEGQQLVTVVEQKMIYHLSHVPVHL